MLRHLFMWKLDECRQTQIVPKRMCFKIYFAKVHCPFSEKEKKKTENIVHDNLSFCLNNWNHLMQPKSCHKSSLDFDRNGSSYLRIRKSRIYKMSVLYRYRRNLNHIKCCTYVKVLIIIIYSSNTTNISTDYRRISLMS